MSRRLPRVRLWPARRKLAAGQIVALLVGLLISGAAIWALRTLALSANGGIRQEAVIAENVEALSQHAALWRRQGQLYLLTRAPTHLKEAEEARKRFHSGLQELLQSDPPPPVAAEARQIQSTSRAYERAFNALVGRLPELEPEEVAAQFRGEVEAPGDRLSSELQQVQAFQMQRLRDAWLQSRTESGRAAPAVIIIGGLALVVSLLLAILLARALARDERARAALHHTLGELQRSEARFRRLVDANVIGVFIWRTDGTIRDANDAFLQMLGYTREELDAGALRWDQLMPKEQWTREQQMLEQLKTEGAFTPFETRYLSKTGEEVPVLMGGALFEGSHEEGISFLVDTRERHRAERNLRFLAEAGSTLVSSLDYLETLPRMARLCLPQLGDWCAVDLDEGGGKFRRVTLVHRVAEKERQGRSLMQGEVADAAQLDGLAEAMRVGRSEIRNQRREVLDVLAHDTGHIGTLLEMGCESLLMVPLVARGRSIGGIYFVRGAPHRPYGEAERELALDLARRCALAVDNARLYAEAREAIAVRDEFLSIASHELRTPMTAMMLQLQGLHRQLESAGSDTSLRKVETVERQTRRLNRLVEELLDSSRIRLGRMELHREQADLTKLAAEVVEKYREPAQISGCELQLRTRGPVIGLFDVARMEQVLAKLLANALKYGPGRPVEIEITEQDGIAQLQVRDRGIGIKRENQERIFRRFERAVSAQHYGGMGLGLYIVRQILEAHGGGIRVESAPGEGALFIGTLPLRAAREEHTPVLH